MGAWALASLLLGAVSGGDWTPPENPDPRAILDEARQDACEHRYSVALAKYLWFHQHALDHDAAWAGVRLSFALAEWHDLGQDYPPALAALRDAREAALAAFRNREKSLAAFQSFLDFVSINRTLGEEANTIEEFHRLDAEEPAVAPMVFDLARPALIEAGEYALCGKYLNPKVAWAAAVGEYRMAQAWAGAGPRPEVQEFVETRLTHEAATLIALLVVNGRQPEAQELAAEARREREDAGFQAAIDEALKGVVPEPWP